MILEGIINPGIMEIITNNIKPNITTCEVGVHQGESTVGYASLIKENNGKIILVDWFQGNIGAEFGPHQHKPEDKNRRLNNLKANLDEIGCLDIVTIIDSISWDITNEQIPDDSIDILFIDADHRYESVKKDLKVFIPKVKNGGIVCGDDLENIDLANTFSPEDLSSDCIGRVEGSNGRNCLHPGVIQAIYEEFGKDITVHANWTWSIKKV